MGNYIKNIELINKFLDKSLSKNEIEDFENRLKTDNVFKEEYESQIIFLEGLKRHALKVEIKNAKQSYILNNWLRYLGFLVLGVLVLGFFYLAFNNASSQKNIDLPKQIIN